MPKVELMSKLELAEIGPCYHTIGPAIQRVAESSGLV